MIQAFCLGTEILSLSCLRLKYSRILSSPLNLTQELASARLYTIKKNHPNTSKLRDQTDIDCIELTKLFQY